MCITYNVLVVAYLNVEMKGPQHLASSLVVCCVAVVFQR